METTPSPVAPSFNYLFLKLICPFAYIDAQFYFSCPIQWLNQKKALEFKKKLLKKRAPSSSKTKKVGNGDTKKVQICTQKKAQRTSVDENSSAMLRAEEVQANLPFKFPSFIKYMLPSHVTGGFWLGFPKNFCDPYLPKHDDTVVLVDENEQEYATKYLFGKNGLSGGWRGFSMAHSLLEGDVLVFQLIQPCKFKVFIVRANRLTEIDGAISLLNLDCQSRPIKSDPSAIYIHQDDKQEAMLTLIPNSGHNPSPDQCGNDSDNGFEVFEGIRLSESRVDFKDVKDISGFNILVNGLIIDSEIPAHILPKYYDLCCTRKSFLHDHLLDGFNCKLIAGMITEIVSIADAIRASKISTPHDHLETWDNTMKGFECFGMEVGFLRARLKKLVSMSRGSKNAVEAKRNELAKVKEETSSQTSECGTGDKEAEL